MQNAVISYDILIDKVLIQGPLERTKFLSLKSKRAIYKGSPITYVCFGFSRVDFVFHFFFSFILKVELKYKLIPIACCIKYFHIKKTMVS